MQTEKMNILAIGSHPDDIEYGCGGTLIKYAEKGHRVFLLVVTQGGMGGDRNVRKAEQLDAAQLLKAERVFWGGFTDTNVVMNADLIQSIESVIREVKPSFIFCHHPDDTHQDHRHLAQATITATRYIRNILFYEGPTSQNFNPQVYVDIAVTFEDKIKALEAHKSQISKTNVEDMNIVSLARSSAHFRGIQGRVKFAEGFHISRLFINI
jgi:LmbE family N-acetylglucosaminyl deacetylase